MKEQKNRSRRRSIFTRRSNRYNRLTGKVLARKRQDTEIRRIQTEKLGNLRNAHWYFSCNPCNSYRIRLVFIWLLPIFRILWSRKMFHFYSKIIQMILFMPSLVEKVFFSYSGYSCVHIHKRIGRQSGASRCVYMNTGAVNILDLI